jgi:hypothetical protein
MKFHRKKTEIYVSKSQKKFLKNSEMFLPKKKNQKKISKIFFKKIIKKIQKKNSKKILIKFK